MIRAIIFDLDGTLADTEPLHLAAFAETLAPLGIAVTREDYFRRLVGYDDRRCFATLLGEHGLGAGKDRLRDLIERKASVYERLIAGRDVVIPEAAEFVRQCAARFPLMVATGTLRVEAETILARAGIRALFVDVIAAEDVERGKPAPDCFLAALGRLGFLLRSRPPIAPDECLVVEDTAGGVEAAHCAGMRVLALGDGPGLEAADIRRQSLGAADAGLDGVLRELAAISARAGGG